MPPTGPDSLAFDDVVIDFVGRRLTRGGAEQTLEPKAFAVLALLAGSPGRAFTRDEILDAVWGHRHVTPSVLNRIMSLLRQALGEDAQHPRRLHTVHGIGYRFEMPRATAPAVSAGADSTPGAAGDGAAHPGGFSGPTSDGVTQLPAHISGRDATPSAEAVLSPESAQPRTAAPPRIDPFTFDTEPPARKRLARLGVAIAAGALLVLAGVAWLYKGERIGAATAGRTEGTRTTGAPSSTAANRSRPSLAVLPFADLSQARDQEYLADGLAEEILNQLAQVPALRIVGRSSSFSFKGRNEDLRAIGQKLGVEHLLEGSVRKAGDQLRVTAQLIRADDGSHLWSKTYDRELRDVFAVEDEISRDVARALSVKLNVVLLNREQGGTTNIDAYERYLRWHNSMMRELYDFEHRRERLQLAREMVALDRECVLCLDALASSLNEMAREVDNVQAERLRAEASEVRKQIARTAPESWVAKRDRSNALWLEGKRAEAIALAKEIADSGPATQERVWDYAYMIYAMGHLNETIALVEKVRAIEPAAVFLSRDLQFDYTAARRFEDAEAEYQRGLKLEGSQVEPHYVAFFRQLAGKRPGGLEELRGLHRAVLEFKHYDTPFFRDLGKVLDNREAMLKLARKALADPDVYGGGRHFAYMWTHVADALGDTELTMAAMRQDLESAQGFREHAMSQYPYVTLWNAPYSNVRSHPDYKKLLIEAGVADYWRQTGKWGDGCEPAGTDDFRCQ